MPSIRISLLVWVLMFGLLAAPAWAGELRVLPGVATLNDRVTKALITSDAKALQACLSEDVIVIQPDGTTIRGADAVHQYVADCFAGKAGWFRSVTVEPLVLTQEVDGSSVALTGRVNDVYTLENGSSLVMDSRFSALVVPGPVVEGAAEPQLVIRQIQVAPAAFDNPMMSAVIKKSANALLWAGFIGATVGGVLVAMIIKFLMRKV